MSNKHSNKTEDKKVASTPKVTFKHAEGFQSRYANSVRFESSVYDLKLIFGETDQSTGNEIIHQHTAITIPWSLVKTTEYFLELNLKIHEMINGTVLVPPSQMPTEAQPVPPEMMNDPNAHKAKDIVEKLRAEFIAKL
jgi:hypothetical protein